MDYKCCVRCLMDTMSNEITFDTKGICNFCYEYEIKEKKRKLEMLHPGRHWLYHEFRKQKNYPCLLGLSGGVDSSMCLYFLAKENGIKPLCFSIDNGWNTKESDENIMRLVEGLKVPFFRYTIDYQEFLDLQIALVRAGVKNLEIATDHILLASTYEMAAKYGIKHIISGGNLATEGTMPESYGENANDLRFLKAVFKKQTGRKLKKIPMLSFWKYVYYRFIKRIKVWNLLDYYNYNRAESIKLLEKEFGYKPYGDKHCESLFTKWFQNWYLPKKFGLDKRRPHLSSLIHSGQITRTQAIEELKKPLYYPRLGKFEDEERILNYPIMKKNYGEYPNSQKFRKKISKLYGALRKI